MNEANAPNGPRDVLRDGSLKASIWRNESEKGPFYSASFTRVYSDRNGELRDAHNFSGTDLLRVSELARKTYDRTQELRREDRSPERKKAERSDTPLLDHNARDERRDSFKAQRSQSAQAQKQPDHGR